MPEREEGEEGAADNEEVDEVEKDHLEPFLFSHGV